MAVRRESVVLDLTDNFSAGMARAAAATKLLEHELDGLSGHAVRSQRGLDSSAKSVDNVGSSADRGGKQIDRLSGRLALLTQAAAVLGPALLPIGAAAVPAVAGLSLQLGLAAGAAGVAVLAFQGVGDGLKALNAYQLKPSAENFAKLQDAMDKLGPAGQEFILSLDKMTPKLKAIRSVAEQGLLPGVTDGLNEVIGLMPQFKQVVFTISSTLGDLARGAGAGLTGPEFQRFFDYLQSTARPVLTEMGQTLGNFVHGIASIVMAIDPLSRSFSTGFLSMSQAFATWAAGLSQTQGFQDFVDYISSNGPKALDALAAIGNALLQVVEAAAPVGAAVLPVITSLANALASLADSGAGPALLATAAAVSVLSRSMALLGVNARGMATGGGLASVFGFEKIKSGAAAMTTVTTATERATMSVAKLGKVEAERAATARAGAAQFGKNAALLGGLALASSGLADKTGLANTASLALMGTFLGPWGAAVGGAVGLTMDLAAANNDLETASKASARALASGAIDFEKQGALLKNTKSEYEDYSQSVSRNSSLGRKSIGDMLNGLSDVFTHTSSEQKKSVASQLDDFRALQDGAKSTFQALSGKTFTGGAQGLTDFVSKISPALQRANIDVKGFLDAMSGKNFDPSLIAGGLAAIVSSFRELDSATGKSKAVGQAMADLGNEMASNVSQADALKAALDSLFGVELSQSEATDAAVVALRAMGKAMRDANHGLLNNTKGALAARDATRGYVQAQLTKVQADAAANGSGRQAAQTLLRTRDNIVATARAAGASRKQVAALVAQMGLTPKNLKTIIQTPGLLTAKQQVQALGRLYHLTPKQVHTLISQAGMGKSKADIDALAKKYNLTPKQVTTILRAIDQASGAISRVGGLLAGLNGRTATTFIRTVTQHVDQRLTAPNRTPHATGGFITGPGTSTSDDIPAYLSNGEYVIRAAAVEKYGTHMFDRLNAMHFASGGSVKGGGSSSSSHHQTPAEREHERRVKAANHELGHFKAELGNAANKLKDLRSAAKDFRTSIVESFTHDIFGNGLAGALTQLRADTNDANSMKAALARSRKLGLAANSGAFKALAASGDLGTASDIRTRADARAFQLAFAQRSAATGSLAAVQSNAVYGHALAAQTHELARLRGAVGHLNKTVASLHKKVHDGAEKGTRAGIADQNKKVSQRRRAGR